MLNASDREFNFPKIFNCTATVKHPPLTARSNTKASAAHHHHKHAQTPRPLLLITITSALEHHGLCSLTTSPRPFTSLQVRSRRLLDIANAHPFYDLPLTSFPYSSVRYRYYIYCAHPSPPVSWPGGTPFYYRGTPQFTPDIQQFTSL